MDTQDFKRVSPNYNDQSQWPGQLLPWPTQYPSLCQTPQGRRAFVESLSGDVAEQTGYSRILELTTVLIASGVRLFFPQVVAQQL
jgi:hypothetical protein